MPRLRGERMTVPAASNGVLRAAWLSIALGLALEIILVLLAAGVGGLGELAPIAADTVQKVSWSLLVCVALALGTGASREAARMGLLGLLAAPAAFYAARALHKALLSVLGSIEDSASLGGSLVIAGVKALEYGVLGWLLGRICAGPRAGAAIHSAVGLGVGVGFGSLLLYLSTLARPMTMSEQLALVINELLFPIGCALVIFGVRRFGESVAQARG